MEVTKKDKLLIPVIGCVIIITVIAIAILCYCNQPINKAKDSFVQLIDGTKRIVQVAEENGIINLLNMDKSKIELQANSQVELNENYLTTLGDNAKNIQTLMNDYQLKVIGEVDREEQYLSFNMQYMKAEDGLSLSYYENKNNGYLKSDDLLPKTIALENSNTLVSRLSATLTSQEIEYVLNTLKNAMKKMDFKDNVSTSESSILLGQEEISVYKNTVNVDNSFLNRYMAEVFKILQKDEQAKNAFYQIVEPYYETKEEFDIAMQICIRNVKAKQYEKLLSSEEKIEYSFYTKGKIQAKVLKVELFYMVGETKQGIEWFNHKVEEYDSQINLYTANSSKPIEIKIKMISLHQFKIQIVKAEETLLLEGKIDKEKIDMNFNLKGKEENQTTGKIYYKREITTGKESGAWQISFDSSLVGKGNITVDTLIEQVEDVEKEELNSVISYQKMSAEDMMDVMLNLQKKLPELFEILLHTFLSI